MLGRRGYKCAVAMKAVIRTIAVRARRLSLRKRRHPGAACREGMRSSCLGILFLAACMSLFWLCSLMIWYLLHCSRLGRNYPQPNRHEDGLSSALDTELGEKMAPMEFHGFLDELQGAGDLFLGVPLCKQAEHIHFTPGQRFGT